MNTWSERGQPVDTEGENGGFSFRECGTISCILRGSVLQALTSEVFVSRTCCKPDAGH